MSSLAAQPMPERRPTAGWLLRGQVIHHRLRPVDHRFVYPVFCLRVSLDAPEALESCGIRLNRRGIVSLHYRDYGRRDGSNPVQWVREALAHAGLPSGGAVWLQTFPRLFGYAFNPVSFWFCHHPQGHLMALIAEVNNTFGDHHCYLLQPQGGGAVHAGSELVCSKAFHVSPFLKVEGKYHFSLRETGTTSLVRINHSDALGLLLKTSIGGHLEPLDRKAVRAALWRQPLLTFGVIARIHWQALKLWLRKVPFYGARPPATSQSANGDNTTSPTNNHNS